MMINKIEIFKALSDEIRLRIITILNKYEFNVNELSEVLKIAQPRVSHHMKILLEANLVVQRKDGIFSYYKMSSENDLSKLAFLFNEMEYPEDMSSSAEVFHKRSINTKAFFNSIADRWDSMKRDIFGDLDINSEIFQMIGNCKNVADLGCGNGDLLEYLSSHVENVIGVDSSEKMIQMAKSRTRGKNNVNIRIGSIEYLPFKDNEAECAVMNLVLHHLDNPAESFNEVSRILSCGSRFIIIDFEHHRNSDMKLMYGDKWPGFRKNEIGNWLKNNDFVLKEQKTINVEKGLKLNFFASEKINKV